jgi:drug/metabolite transporter (DMT)-like permease
MRINVRSGVWPATGELLLAASLWGFGFIAARWALTVLDANEVTFARFAVAALVGLPWIWSRGPRAVWQQNLRASFIPAVLLLGTLIFQTWGLNYTTATKSGFITTLYVVFVSLAEAALSRRPMPKSLWLCVLLALLGTALIVDLGFGEINRGDLLTLVCAVLAAAQIYWLGIVSPGVTHAFAFNVLQNTWAALMAWPLIDSSVLVDKFRGASAWPKEAWLGLASLAFGSTVIAFFLQVRAQRRLPPTVSSLIFLLESPFAWLFAMMFLRESFRGLEGLGAVLIFASALMATLIESRREKA